MRTIKRSLAVVLALIFLLLLPVALLALSVQTLLLTPDYYKQQFVKVDLYSRAYVELLPTLVESVELPEDLPLTNQEVSDLIRRLVPESFVRAQTEKIIDEMFAVMTSQKDSVQIIIPLREIKQRIPDEVAELLDRKLAALPTCSASTPFPPSHFEGFPTCLPPGPDGERLRSEFRVQATIELRKASESLPDNLDVSRQFAEGNGGMNQVRANVDLARRLGGDFVLGASVFYALLAVVLILVGILGGNSFNSGVGWVGATLVIGGVGVLLTTVLVVPAPAEVIANSGLRSNMPRELASTVSPLMTSILSDLMLRVQMEAGGLTVLGLLLFFVSRII